ncbi:adhesion G protein-coupled receptor G3 isoform X3 [Loxodonta africana]|uniref:adhesion G protein-coupled receptor G3 isoform X3 n=1 Tax=Loxodonta africana TaxID=9785 RepID=UPI0030D3C6DD
MVTPRSFRVLHFLLLLLLASGEKYPEKPRNACLGVVNSGQYDSFSLNSTATCFTMCRRKDDSCNLKNLQRYWLDYETHLVENTSIEIVNTSFVKTLVHNFSTDTSDDLYFSLTPSQIPRQVMENENKPPDRVLLPRSFFESLRGKRSSVRLAVTILDVGLGNLFKNMTLSCVFWDATKGPTGDWAFKGCSTEHRDRSTVCRCDHLTFFALLLRPILDEATVQVLTRISQAGCGASMLFLAFTIALYTVLRFFRQRFKSEDTPKIHVALSVSLFLLNLSFLITVVNGSQGSNAACWARGAVFHYFLLCTFTWMGLEAFHLYLLVIKVFNTYFGHYFLKLSLVGWGLPALVVIGTGSTNSYGRYTIQNEENRTTLELCWFRETTALYVTVHGYFLITFLFSAMVLGLVAWKIFTLSSITAGKEQGLNWKGVLTVLGLSSLMGMTWGLAILTPLGLFTIYIFAVLNSLQGIFIFGWFALLYFPSQSASSSATTQADQTHSVSHG